MTLLIATQRIPDYTLFLLQGGVPPDPGPTLPSRLGSQVPCRDPSLQPVPVILGSNVAAESACILVLEITQVLIIVPLHKAPKNRCFKLVLKKSLKNPLNCKEIQPVHPKGDQSWVFIGRTDAEAETPILSPPDAEWTH